MRLVALDNVLLAQDVVAAILVDLALLVGVSVVLLAQGHVLVEARRGLLEDAMQELERVGTHEELPAREAAGKGHKDNICRL